MIRDAWNNSKFYTDLFQGWTGNHSVRLMDAMHAWNDYEQTGVYNCDIPALTVMDNNVEHAVLLLYRRWFLREAEDFNAGLHFPG